MTVKSFGYYGTVGDQVNETRGAVNRLWVCGFDGDVATRKENILSAKVPVTLDVAECLFPQATKQPHLLTPADVEAMDVLLPGARHRLYKMQEDMGEAWAHVDSIILQDELNLKQAAKPKSVEAAAALVREVWPEKKLASIQSRFEPYLRMDLFDQFGLDHYPHVDKVLWPWPEWMRWAARWGEADHVQRMLRDDQELILMPGASDLEAGAPASIGKWLIYGRKQRRPVHIVAFMGRPPAYETTMRGILDWPELREQYLAAGREVVA